MDTRARTWADELAGAGPPDGAAAARLRDLLLGIARAELDRRQDQLPAGAEPGLLAGEAAAGALAAVSAELDERSRAPFRIWAAKFVMAEVSAKIARQQWRAGAVPAAGPEWAAQVTSAAPAHDGVFGSLRLGVERDLTAQQRVVFQTVLLGGMPLDVLALEFGSTRSAIYKSMFEARRRLSDRLAADGHPADRPGPRPPGGPAGLAGLLAVTPGDAGCEVTFQEVDSYVSSELSGGDPGRCLAAVRVHLDSCAACQQDYQGLLAASRAAQLSG